MLPVYKYLLRACVVIEKKNNLDLDLSLDEPLFNLAVNTTSRFDAQTMSFAALVFISLT